MQLTVCYFAQLREQAACGQEPVEIPGSGPVDIDQVIDQLGRVRGQEFDAALRGKNVRIAVNQQLVAGPVAIHAGDEVAFLPPVTGG